MMTLKEARASKLLTVRELAKLADVAPSTVYLAESGRTTPRFAMIRKMAKALEIEPSEIQEFAVVMRGGAIAPVPKEPPSS